MSVGNLPPNESCNIKVRYATKLTTTPTLLFQDDVDALAPSILKFVLPVTR